MNDIHVMACRVRGAIEVFSGNPFQAVLSRALYRHVRLCRVTAIPVASYTEHRIRKEYIGRSKVSINVTVIVLVVDKRRCS
jgi:hypothetical protein